MINDWALERISAERRRALTAAADRRRAAAETRAGGHAQPGTSVVSAAGRPATSGTLRRDFTPRGSGTASTVPSCRSAVLRTIARPGPEPGRARALADR